MDPILAFMVAVILVSLLTMKIGISPFLSLLVSALVYGLLAGMGPELIGTIFGLLVFAATVLRWHFFV